MKAGVACVFFGMFQKFCAVVSPEANLLKQTFRILSPVCPLPSKKESSKRKCAMFKAELFTIAKTWKHPKCPLTDEWIKMW